MVQVIEMGVRRGFEVLLVQLVLEQPGQGQQQQQQESTQQERQRQREEQQEDSTGQQLQLPDAQEYPTMNAEIEMHVYSATLANRNRRAQLTVMRYSTARSGLLKLALSAFMT